MVTHKALNGKGATGQNGHAKNNDIRESRLTLYGIRLGQPTGIAQSTLMFSPTARNWRRC